jgi:hypothetical protein
MNKCRYAVFMLLVVFLISGCGSNDGKTNKNSKSDKITKGLEQYVGKSLAELTELVGGEPEVTYSEKGEAGYPENGTFKFSDDIGIEGRLRVDSFMATLINDTSMYIEEISVELPYENAAGIKANDDTETVKKKLSDTSISISNDDEAHIYYEHNGYRYAVGMHNAGYKARILIIDQPNTESKFSEAQFDTYCKAVPGGFYLENGDYIAATANGLAQIYKNTRGISLNTNMGQGKIYESENGIIFETSDGKSKYLINQYGIAAATLITSEQPVGNVQPSNGQTNKPQQNIQLVKFKEDVKIYQQYALEKWGYDTKRFYDVADFNNDGNLELYSIYNMSSPSAGTMQQSKLELYAIKEGQVKLLDFYTVSEPIVEGGAEFTNYYKGFVPGEGDYFIIDNVNTRMGSGHSIRVGRIDLNGKFNEVDAVDFAYPNMDLANGEGIFDYPRAGELLSKYGVNYDSLLIGLGDDYSLLFGFAYNDGVNSYDYFRQLLSGDKDSEILYKLTGEWRE